MFVLEGYYYCYIWWMWQIYQCNLVFYICWIWEYFFCEICIMCLKGGFLLWIELFEQVDMVCIVWQLCCMNIQVVVGLIFLVFGKYCNCLCINCVLLFSEIYCEVLK